MPSASPLIALLLGSLLAVLVPATWVPQARASTAPAPLLRLQDPALLESSGLAVSARRNTILWTHADGGSVAQVRAVNRRGRTVAVVTLDGIDPFDPEALAPSLRADGTPLLWLGDIGDNREARPDVSVFRFVEPRKLTDRTVTATWFRFTYPDGSHDAEALLVAPGTGRVFIATKGFGGAGLYRAPRRLVTRDLGTNRLTRVADVPVLVTDGAFLPDGRFVLRTYTSVFLYGRLGNKPGALDELDSDPLPAQPQGESIAVDGARLLVGSEGRRSAVYAVPVPGPVSSAADDLSTGPTARAAPGGDPVGGGNSGLPAAVPAWALGAGGVALLLAAAALIARRRRRW